VFTYSNTDEEDFVYTFLLYVCLYSRLSKKIDLMPNFGKQSKPLSLGSGEDSAKGLVQQFPRSSSGLDNSFPGLLHYLGATVLTVSQLGMK
jgi:hypothetical protein